MSELMLLGIVLVVALVLLVLLLIVWQRMSAWNGAREQQMQHAVSQLLQELDRSFDQAQQSGSEHNASLREHAGNLAHQQREELSRSLFQVQNLLNTQLKDARDSQTQEGTSARETLNQQLSQNNSQIMAQLAQLNETTERRLSQMRENIEQRLVSIEQKNEQKLEQMRATVDE